MTAPKKTPKKTNVTLLKAHTHEGVEYPAGSKIEVTEAQRDWLISQKVVAASNTATQESK